MDIIIIQAKIIIIFVFLVVRLLPISILFVSTDYFNTCFCKYNGSFINMIYFLKTITNKLLTFIIHLSRNCV